MEPNLKKSIKFVINDDNNDESKKSNFLDNHVNYALKSVEIEKQRIIKQAEKKYKKLSQIINEESILTYIKMCITIEALVLFYYAYNLISGFQNIIQFTVAFLYLIDYLISLSNLILYLKFTIQYSEEKKSKSKSIKALVKVNNMNKLNKSRPSSAKKDSLANSRSSLAIDEEDENSTSIGYLIFAIYFRIITWYIKYIVYIIVIFLVSNLNAVEYTKIPLLIIEYILYHFLKFYTMVLIRAKKIKSEHNLNIES